MRWLSRVGEYGGLVRFSHTVFALPFAVMGAVLAAGGVPPLRTDVLVLVAMVAARSAAMAMNRLADHRLDAENPRTRGRHLPAGRLGRGEVWGFLAVNVGIFIGACALMNRLTLELSPFVLLVLLSYPYAKRFTSLCHLWLGAALGLSPVGAFVAVRGTLGADALPAVLLGAAVVFWTAGFDVIYALLDLEFDRGVGVASIPARFGERGALAVSAAFHVVTLALFAATGVTAGLPWIYYAGVGGVAVLLVYEHWIVKPGDHSRIDTAFFTLNGAVSLLLMGALFVSIGVKP